MYDTERQTRQHQPHRHLGVNSGPAIVEAIAGGKLFSKPRQVQHAVDAHRHMIVGDELPQRSTDEQLPADFAPCIQACRTPHDRESPRAMESGNGSFFNSPRVHFMRNVLARAGKQGRRVISAFIATAFVQNDAKAASQQWRHVADQIRPKVPKLDGAAQSQPADRGIGRAQLSGSAS
jgi:hypothetical protein